MSPWKTSAALCLICACNRGDRSDAQSASARAEVDQPATERADAPKAKPLSPEDIALIEADPKNLTPEQRTKRAYALRRKIMQNPDSETAKNLERARKAIESGELVPELPNQSIKFEARKPESKTESEPGHP